LGVWLQDLILCHHLKRYGLSIYVNREVFIYTIYYISLNCEKNIFKDILGAFTFGFLENQKNVRLTKNASLVVNI